MPFELSQRSKSARSAANGTKPQTLAVYASPIAQTAGEGRTLLSDVAKYYPRTPQSNPRRLALSRPKTRIDQRRKAIRDFQNRVHDRTLGLRLPTNAPSRARDVFGHAWKPPHHQAPVTELMQWLHHLPRVSPMVGVAKSTGDGSTTAASQNQTFLFTLATCEGILQQRSPRRIG